MFATPQIDEHIFCTYSIKMLIAKRLLLYVAAGNSLVVSRQITKVFLLFICLLIPRLTACFRLEMFISFTCKPRLQRWRLRRLKKTWNLKSRNDKQESVAMNQSAFVAKSDFGNAAELRPKSSGTELRYFIHCSGCIGVEATKPFQCVECSRSSTWKRKKGLNRFSSLTYFHRKEQLHRKWRLHFDCGE